jgi:MraZ protein
MITGEFRCSLDDKGRLLLPSRMRAEIAGTMIVVTRGVEKCLWLFPTDNWKKFSDNLIGSTSLFQEKARLIQRRMIAPAQEAEFDKAGRIVIPQTLRDFADLKKDCIILGVTTRIEVWDEALYMSYWNENEAKFQDAAEELGGKIPL